MDNGIGNGKSSVMDVTQLKKLRPCGRLETYSTARHHLGFYNNVGLTATYTTSRDFSDRGTPLEEASLKRLVFAALRHVIAEHPNLSAVPVNEDTSYPHAYFAHLPEIDLTTCVEFHTRGSRICQGDEADSELDQLLRSQHSRNFKGNVPKRPFWQLAITSFPREEERFTASWIFHHALSDGASSTLFHKTFLEGLNIASASPRANVGPLVSTPSTPLAPPLEDLHPMTISWPFFLRAVAGSLLPSYFASRPPSLWTGTPIDTIVQAPVPSYINTIVISAGTARAFTAQCRRQGTSVTAALSTLLAGAIFELIDSPHDEIKIDIPISLRPFLAIQDKQMVNAITNHTSTFYRTTGQSSSSVKDGFEWDTARRIKSELSQEVEKKGTDNPIALLKYVSDMFSYFTDKLGTQRESTAEVSNLGLYRGRTANLEKGEQTIWAMGRMVFSQSLNRTGPQISLSAVTGGDGCLVLNFIWPQEFARYEEQAGEHHLCRLPDMIKKGIENLVLADALA